MMRYLLRVRVNDDSEWGEPAEYPSRKTRDYAASFNRIIGGIRTHSYEQGGAEVTGGGTTAGCVTEANTKEPTSDL